MSLCEQRRSHHLGFRLTSSTKTIYKRAKQYLRHVSKRQTTCRRSPRGMCLTIGAYVYSMTSLRQLLSDRSTACKRNTIPWQRNQVEEETVISVFRDLAHRSAWGWSHPGWMLIPAKALAWFVSISRLLSESQKLGDCSLSWACQSRFSQPRKLKRK